MNALFCRSTSREAGGTVPSASTTAETIRTVLRRATRRFRTLISWMSAGAAMSPEEIRKTIARLVADSGKPELTGVCCINLDQNVGDEQVGAIFETVEACRKAESLS